MLPHGQHSGWRGCTLLQGSAAARHAALSGMEDEFHLCIETGLSFQNFREGPDENDMQLCNYEGCIKWKSFTRKDRGSPTSDYSTAQWLDHSPEKLWILVQIPAPLQKDGRLELGGFHICAAQISVCASGAAWRDHNCSTPQTDEPSDADLLYMAATLEPRHIWSGVIGP
ncbi:hypothetical protein UY3_06091 [Chelonia mydas]|uniref:Uncharacterized protein n=1 Tax=Chelonia mydas TaxID=8469 RepID=M7BFH5_CHEMY|nr:hypothetical protein UY3_06091 [Chelonia mydas]